MAKTPHKIEPATVVVRCSRHPTYQVLRKPTADCKVCRNLWDMRERCRWIKEQDND